MHAGELPSSYTALSTLARRRFCGSEKNYRLQDIQLSKSRRCPGLTERLATFLPGLGRQAFHSNARTRFRKLERAE